MINKRLVLWCLPALVWVFFTAWYTDLGGLLSDEEIAQGLATMKSGDYNPERLKLLETFLRNDTGRQFLMVNNIDMSDEPPPMPGFGPDATAADYRDYYMEHMYPQLFKRACHPVFYGAGLGFVADLSGIKGAAVEGWDTAALFRYRSRRSFLEIITHPAMQGRHDYKLAAMTKTIAYPVEATIYLSDLRFILFLLLGFVTAVVDGLIYRRGSGRVAAE